MLSKPLREAVVFSGAVAALFLIAGLCCLYWAYNRGAFGAARVEHPVNLKVGSEITVHFLVPSKGDHDVEIWYPRNASDDVNNDLGRMLGKATLRTGDAPVAEIELPVKHTRSDRDGAAMVVFTGPMEPRNDYSLSLQIDRIPPGLARSQAEVKVELDPLYYSIFLQVELEAAALLLLALSCVVLSVRWWRAATRAAGDQENVKRISDAGT